MNRVDELRRDLANFFGLGSQDEADERGGSTQPLIAVGLGGVLVLGATAGVVALVDPRDGALQVLTYIVVLVALASLWGLLLRLYRGARRRRSARENQT
jgi:hypothetical protein